MDGYQHPYMYNAEGSCDRRAASWFSGPPTYQVNAANVALLPNQAPLYRPSFNQSAQGYSNQSGIPYASAQAETTQSTNGAVGGVQSCSDSRDTMMDIPIRVINPKKKRDVKTYILKDIQPQMIRTLKCLREEILEQLGKGVVSFQLNFDVGYMSGSHRICFTEKEVGSLFPGIAKDGGQLWCEGILPPDSVPSLKRKRSNSTPVVIDSSGSDDDTEPPPQKQKLKRSALDEKAERVQKLADKLQAKHGDTYNKIQYKLWAEAMDVNKHKSMERPPPGTIWGAPKESKRSQSTSEAMNEAFTNMATTLVSALNKPSPSSPISNKSTSSIQSEVGVSPGRLADLQGKFFTQIEQLHKLFDCGALSKEQFEKRKQVILDRLDELASK